MNRRLAALLAVAGVAIVSGTTYLLARPERGVTMDMITDAGLLSDCTPMLMECQVRNQCTQLPDGGGRPRYGTVTTKVMKCPAPNPDAPDVLIFRWPRRGGEECYEPVGDPKTACVVVDPNCADATLCAEDQSGEQPVRAAQDRCACWQPDAGPCSVKSPTGSNVSARVGVTFAAPFAGPGCVRKSCDELAGENGGSWPAQCPVP